MALVPLAAAAWCIRREGASGLETGATDGASRAFQPAHALGFSVTVTALTWAAAWLGAQLGGLGALAGVAVGGFADAPSATASAGVLASRGTLSEPQALVAILLALAANTVTKLAVAYATGGPRYLGRLFWPHVAMLAAASLPVVGVLRAAG
jgi:uncharacterized membrane protein (DUF4010 family)